MSISGAEGQTAPGSTTKRSRRRSWMPLEVRSEHVEGRWMKPRRREVAELLIRVSLRGAEQPAVGGQALEQEPS